MSQNNKNILYCSFCGKSQHEVRKLIAGPTVFICDECVELCMDIIKEENKDTLVKHQDGLPSPKEICSILDELRPRKNGAFYNELITFVKDRPGHDFRYAIDSARITKDTGWTPSESFVSGLKKTIKWYLENEEWWRKIQKNAYNQERLGA